MKREDWYSKYVQSLSEEEVVKWFHSLLNRYPAKTVTEESAEEKPSLPRSCTIVWRVSSLTAVSEADIDLLEKLKEQHPAVMFVITTNHGPLSPYEEVDAHTLPLYVPRG